MKCPMCKTPMAGGTCPRCKYKSDARGMGMIGMALSDRDLDLRVAAAPMMGAQPGAMNAPSGQTQGVSNEAIDKFHACQIMIDETLQFLESLEQQSGGQAPRVLQFMTGALWAAKQALDKTIQRSNPSGMPE